MGLQDGYAVILIAFRADTKCHGFSFLLNRAFVNPDTSMSQFRHACFHLYKVLGKFGGIKGFKKGCTFAKREGYFSGLWT